MYVTCWVMLSLKKNSALTLANYLLFFQTTSSRNRRSYYSMLHNVWGSCAIYQLHWHLMSIQIFSSSFFLLCLCVVILHAVSEIAMNRTLTFLSTVERRDIIWNWAFIFFLCGANYACTYIFTHMYVCTWHAYVYSNTYTYCYIHDKILSFWTLLFICPIF